jgi:hypothetical protein
VKTSLTARWRTALILATIIGFLALALAAPYLVSTVMKPMGVPGFVRADYTVLNGLRWDWCDRAGDGAIWWGADRESLGLSVHLGSTCETPDFTPSESPTLNYNSRAADLTISFFPSSSSVGAGAPCQFRISPPELDRLGLVLAEVRSRTSDVRRERLLAEAWARLRNLDQGMLVTTTSGSTCTAGSSASAQSG